MSHHYTELTLSDRIQIQTLLEAFSKVRAIARTLERAHTSISREIYRNLYTPTDKYGKPIKGAPLATSQPKPMSAANNGANKPKQARGASRPAGTHR